MTVATAQPLMTADEFAARHGDESGIELVDGHIVRYPMPTPEHGYVGMKAGFVLMEFTEPRGLGRVMGLDTFIRTKRGADTVRGADVCYVSYAQLPKAQPLPEKRFEVAPELVIEVRSPTDRVSEMTKKAEEYLDAGVKVVVVLDPGTRSAAVFRPDELPHRLDNGDELVLPDVLPGFACPVRRFFE